MTSGIYKITNDRTGEVYVGQSYNIEKRWEQHKEELKNGTHHNSGLQEDYYKGDTFSYEIIEEENNKQKREDKEIIYIQRENSFLEGYNQTLGGGYDEKRGEMGYGGRLYSSESESWYLEQDTYEEEKYETHPGIIKDKKVLTEGPFWDNVNGISKIRNVNQIKDKDILTQGPFWDKVNNVDENKNIDEIKDKDTLTENRLHEKVNNVGKNKNNTQNQISVKNQTDNSDWITILIIIIFFIILIYFMITNDVFKGFIFQFVLPFIFEFIIVILMCALGIGILEYIFS